MHACLNVDEIVRLLACELVASEGNATAVALACCCKNFEDPVLDVLWETQQQLDLLLFVFPEGVWQEGIPHLVSPPMTPYPPSLNRTIGKIFKRTPTTAEWVRFKKYARRMRELKLNLLQDLIPPDTLSALQLRTLNQPLLPSLKSVEFQEATADTIPFFPLFLSNTTIDIDIRFAAVPPAVMVASMIINLPTLCPNIRKMCLNPLPRDPTVTDAVSEMLLTCNLGTLRELCVDSPLTKEAYEAVCKLPELRGLWMVIQGPTSLSTVSLPNLTELDVEYHQGHDWLRAFHGTTLSNLAEVAFHANCEQIGDLLETFEGVALATSASATLSTFGFYTSCSWNPAYYALLSFKQLKVLIIEFSCDNGCSSVMDDEILTTLARAMPKLETLQLGKAPCQARSNVTAQGLIALTNHCFGLSKLRVHFRTDDLVMALSIGIIPTPSSVASHLPREGCVLTSLEVGEIPIPQHYSLTVALTLLRIFPRLLIIEYEGDQWAWVAETVRLSKQIDHFVYDTGKMGPRTFDDLQ